MVHAPHSRLSNTLRPAVVGLALLLASCTRATVNAGQTVSIELDASPHAVKSRAGFLHGMNGKTPAGKFLKAVQPGLWRAGILTKDIYKRATEAGARFTIVCSDYWGYDAKRMPLENRERYVALMEGIARRTKNLDIIYDIWNEPNVPAFFHGSFKEYCETFRLGHDTIRRIRPDAVIAGPSTSGFVPKFLERFLDYCLAQNLQVQVLSWHDYRHGPKLAQIPPTLLEVRRHALDSGKYKAVGIREIHINEAMDSTVYLSPASVFATLTAFELGRADAAGRSAWEEDFKNNLGGLLTVGDSQPRAVWWVYKYYAASLPRRVGMGLGGEGCAWSASIIPGKDQDELLVLLGCYRLTPGEEGMRPVDLDVKGVAAALGLAPDASITVEGSLIPPTGSAALPSPRPLKPHTVQLSGGGLNHTVKLPIEGLLVLRVRPALP